MMSTSIQSKQTLAVFGATGGCILNFLILALQNGYIVSALARTPAKLTALLAEHNIVEKLLSNLTIIQGSSKDEAKVTEALQINGKVVDMIVSGLGPIVSFTPLPSFGDSSVCETSATTLVKSLSTLRDASPKTYTRPAVVVISPTGISEYGRDIPLAMVPLYHVLLKIPHRDKKAMERIVSKEGRREGGVFGSWCVVRASLLKDGGVVGAEKLKIGIEEGENSMSKDAIGYSVCRKDVGAWIFESLVGDKEGKRGLYLNHCIGITS